MQKFEQNSDAEVTKIPSMRRVQWGMLLHVLLKPKMHFVCRPDNFALSVRKFTDITSR